MKKVTFLLFCILLSMKVTAQEIKFADEQYVSSVFSSNKVDELNIEELFQRYDGSTKGGIEYSFCAGDTILYRDRGNRTGICINHTEKTISYEEIEGGYYVIDELYLCKEGIDVLSKKVQELVEDGYNKKAGVYVESSGNDCTLLEFKGRLKFQNRKPGEKYLLSCDKMCRLVSIGKNKEYLVRRIDSDALPKKHYSYMYDYFYNNEFYLIEEYTGRLQSRIYDDLNKKYVDLYDNKYLCKDVVVDPQNLNVAIVFQGEKSGVFAMEFRDFSNVDFTDITKEGSKIVINSMNDKKYDYQGIKEIPAYIDEHSSCVIRDDELKKYIHIEENKINRENALREEIKLKNKLRHEKWVAKMIGEYGPEFGNAIVNRKIKLNMTKEMVKESLGLPFWKYSAKDKSGEYEVWKYNLGTEIYFLEGKVVGIVNN